MAEGEVVSSRFTKSVSVVLGLTFLATGISACSKAPTLTASLEADAVVTGAKATVQGALSTPQAGIPIKVEINSAKGEFVKVGASKVTDKDGVYKIAFAPSAQGSFEVRAIATLASGESIESASVVLKVQTRRVFYKAAGDKYLACVKPRNEYATKANKKYFLYGKPTRDDARTNARLTRTEALCLTSYSWPVDIAIDVTGLAEEDTQIADTLSEIGDTLSPTKQSALYKDVDYAASTRYANRIRLALGLPKRV